MLETTLDQHCVSSRWEVSDVDQLARIIAIVAMGQATYAAHIIEQLLPAVPRFTDKDLIAEATLKLKVKTEKLAQGVPRAHRDGFMFEVISWTAAKQTCGARVYLKDPHTSATSQGVDGLMIELDQNGTALHRATIFEDKCTDDPRGFFTGKVIPGFKARHSKKRSAELVALAATLIKLSGLNDDEASKASQGIMDTALRRYRAAFAVPSSMDSDEERKKLFKGFDVLAGLKSDQRIGASFVVDASVRDWFDRLAERSISYLNELSEGL